MSRIKGTCARCSPVCIRVLATLFVGDFVCACVLGSLFRERHVPCASKSGLQILSFSSLHMEPFLLISLCLFLIPPHGALFALVHPSNFSFPQMLCTEHFFLALIPFSHSQNLCPSSFFSFFLAHFTMMFSTAARARTSTPASPAALCLAAVLTATVQLQHGGISLAQSADDIITCVRPSLGRLQ